jgi:hypothetical protein
VSESDGAGVVDFLKCAGEFGGENWSADQSSSDSCAQNMGNDTHQYFLDICFFYEAGQAALFVLRMLVTAPEALRAIVWSVEHESCQSGNKSLTL